VKAPAAGTAKAPVATTGKGPVPPRPVDAGVVGGSAGGVEALLAILPSLPAKLRAPVLVVVHQPRDRRSVLAEILDPRCTVPVREAEDKEPIERGTVYLAPPDYHLLVEQGPTLALSADALVHYSRPSIDVLFESAADVYGERLLGMILSGANEDGAAGLAAIAAAGGTTVVQDPETAQASAMPAAALARTAVDLVLSLDEIGGLLSTLGTAGAGAEAEARRGGK